MAAVMLLALRLKKFRLLPTSNDRCRLSARGFGDMVPSGELEFLRRRLENDLAVLAAAAAANTLAGPSPASSGSGTGTKLRRLPPKIESAFAALDVSRCGEPFRDGLLESEEGLLASEEGVLVSRLVDLAAATAPSMPLASGCNERRLPPPNIESTLAALAVSGFAEPFRELQLERRPVDLAAASAPSMLGWLSVDAIGA